MVSKICKVVLGEEPLCRFTYVEDDEYSAQDYLNMAVQLNSIGVKIDKAKLKEATKLAFISDEQVQEWTPPPPEN